MFCEKIIFRGSTVSLNITLGTHHEWFLPFSSSQKENFKKSFWFHLKEVDVCHFTHKSCHSFKMSFKGILEYLYIVQLTNIYYIC